MVVKQSDYEELLSCYSNHKQTLRLLKQYRPYLEFIPSMRRPAKSLISIPLPIVKIRKPVVVQPDQAIVPLSKSELVRVPCDLVLLMCDPDWKIKTGVEIFILIYRPEEDFSDLLGRWRNTQLLMDYDYEWLMPPQHRHMFGEGVGQGDIYPLFVIFPDTPKRIQRGLQGAGLPFVVHQPLGSTTDGDADSLEELDPNDNDHSSGNDFNYDLSNYDLSDTMLDDVEDDVSPGEALS